MATSQNIRKRNAGRPAKYTFDVNAIAAAMSNVSGNRDSYRDSNSFWGEILLKLGLCNKLLARKNLYVRWKENRNGMRTTIEELWNTSQQTSSVPLKKGVFYDEKEKAISPASKEDDAELTSCNSGHIDDNDKFFVVDEDNTVNVRRNYAACVIQKHARLMMQRKQKVLIFNSARIIQAYVRGFLVRRNLHRRHQAVNIIRTCYLSYLVAKKTRQHFKDLRMATLRLQSLYRGKMARRHVEKIKAARIIQSRWLSYLTRREFLAQKQAALVIQTEVRKFIVQRHYRNLKASVSFLQKRYREKLMAKLQQRDDASRVLQCHYRAYVLSKDVQEKYKNTRNAIIKLQALWKGYQVRMNYSKQRTCIFLIQSRVRGYIMKRQYLK
ncbi:abnormal spindle-like microcephaly-associated protein homolog [Xenia sp. Carnegie-2017]|uniref:abnormal spindle-like microcephaly-associated protein homolog n=1 Tax=Xenia sp. Carnegie-2017 TaxID=2897299 RepID=UPI001F035EC4|nr:abnormal spindle-like microcephaly-associated protein homolog [Xenia sp. Carnegie-2017]